jgi:hypothetical protein
MAAAIWQFSCCCCCLCGISNFKKVYGTETEILRICIKAHKREEANIRYTDEKENQIFLVSKEIQSGAVAKSYMRKGFLIYEDMLKYFPIYEDAVSFI